MANQITELRLLNVPLENDYKHTLFFDTEANQVTYFKSKTIYTDTDFSYQRKDNVIRYPKHYDDLSSCNYVMYRNSAYSTKWYYAFITEKTYINDERTDIHIETDVMQTYMFNYTVKPSFVEREHVNDDTVGLHTFPENLEVGEYICEYKDTVTELQDAYYVLGLTEKLHTYVPDVSASFEKVSGTRYDGIFSGIYYQAHSSSKISAINELLDIYAREGKSDAIKCIFMYPGALLTFDEYNRILGSEYPKEFYKTFNRISQYSGYKPVNKKLYTFPYQYLLASNNNGGSAIYHFERFNLSSPPRFAIQGCLTPGGSIRLVPQSYKGQSENNDEGLNLGKYPICNWTSDEYTNWLTQNSVNIGLNIASGVGQIVAGGAMAIVTGGAGAAVGGSQVIGGVSTIANQLAQIHQMSFTPPQSRGNINCGDIITASRENTFHLQAMRITDEYLQIIDNYFSMFGYKCNRVKVPHKNHRSNYWYTKTIDASIDGAIPNKDMQTIKNCYNNGITFWKNPANIGDYSVSNTII